MRLSRQIARGLELEIFGDTRLEWQYASAQNGAIP